MEKKTKLGLIIGISILVVALIAVGVWYAMRDTGPADPDTSKPVVNDDRPRDPGPAGKDPDFFRNNLKVNDAVLASIKNGGSGDRVETRQTATVALRGTVVAGDKVINDGLVVIEYAEQDLGRKIGERPVGTIKSVSEYSAGDVPEDVTLVDVTGSCIYPGFIDMHNHVHYNAFDLWTPTYDIYPNRDVWPGDARYKDWKKLKNYFGKDQKNMTTETTKWGEIRGLLTGTTMMQGYDGDFNGSYGLCRNVENNGNLFGVDRINQSVMPVSGWYKGKRAEADREKVTNAFASGKAVRYIMHFCEGIDAKIHEEFEQLKAFNMLREEMVGIHSTALRGADWDDIAAAGMKAVWSPLSNLILYNETTDIKGAIEHGVAFRNLSFAPDWAPSGTPGMIEELKVVAEYNEKQLDGYLTARQMYEMMTINPANISSYDEFVGEIKAGLRADITVVKMTGDDPYVSLQQAKIEDVNLVMIDGQPLYGTLEVYKKFDKGNDYEIFVMNDVEKAIDITEEGIDKGDQTLRQLMELLIAGFKDIRQNVPFEFPDDVDAYCHLSPMFWPQPTSYTNLMYGCVLGEGTDSTKDRDAFRNSDHYRNRNADAKNQYNTYKEQVFGITTTSRGGRNNQGGQSSRNNRSDRNNRNNQNSRNDRNSSAGEGDDGGE